MFDSISLLDVIKEGGYEASLITTFNANLPFYEEVVLRRLAAAGCQQNIVLMDQAQCIASWSAEATRPKLAGAAYSLVPLRVAGAFHPKVCILVGKKKATVLVGSHNLTLSGFGYNREVCNRIDVVGKDDEEGRAALSLAWKMVTEWIQVGGADLPPALIESVLSFSKNITLISRPSTVGESSILHQHPGSTPLLEQIQKAVTGDVIRIGVIGAFFDKELAFLGQLHARWPRAEVVVAIDPDTVHLPQVSDVQARFVDVRPIFSVVEGGNKYLHAKALFIEQANEFDHVFISGSANPSRPAWLGEHGANIEAVVVRKGRAARLAAEKLTLTEMFSLPSISEEELQAAAARSVVETIDPPSTSEEFFVGISDGQSQVTIAVGTTEPLIDHVRVLSGDEKILREESSIQVQGGLVVIALDNHIKDVRSCELYSDGVLVGRAMVAHPHMLGAAVKPAHRQIRDALGAIDPSGENISEMLKAVEKAVFDTSNEEQIESELRGRRGSSSGSVGGARPESLEISVSELTSRKTKRRKLVEHADIVTLIDLLSRKVGQELREAESIPTDSAGRSEEELIGTEDEAEGEGDSGSGARTDGEPAVMADAEIAKTVAAKVGKLISKMLKKLTGADDEEQQARALIQLIAVVSLIKELSRIERLDRWRRARVALVSNDDRRALLDQAVTSLFGSRTRLIDALSEEGEESHEAFQLRLLLLWLAWAVKEKVPDGDVDKFNDDLPKTLKARALFLALAPPIAGDEVAYGELQGFIKATRSPNPPAVAGSESWMRRTIEFAELWSRELDEAPRIDVGGCCLVADGRYPRVVTRVTDDSVTLCEHEDAPRTYQRRSVIPVHPAGLMLMT